MYLIGKDPDVPDEAHAAIITAYSMDDQCAHKQERIDVTDKDFCRAKDCTDEIGIPCDNGRLCFGFSSPLCIYSMGKQDQGYLRGKLDFEASNAVRTNLRGITPFAI